MGVYRIPIRPEKIETISRAMQAIGFPVVSTRRLEDGVHYACANPKRPNKNWMFWITHKTKTDPQFFMCGLSQLSKQLVRTLSGADFFDKDSASNQSSMKRVPQKSGAAV
jgi:hypothetical protein